MDDLSRTGVLYPGFFIIRDPVIHDLIMIAILIIMGKLIRDHIRKIFFQKIAYHKYVCHIKDLDTGHHFCMGFYFHAVHSYDHRSHVILPGIRIIMEHAHFYSQHFRNAFKLFFHKITAMLFVERFQFPAETPDGTFR